MQGKTIVFLGTHGQYNIGDELLLETFLSQLGEGNRYLVNSYAPEFTAAHLRPRFQAEVFHTTGERRRFLRALLRCDLLFFGGGSIIKELYASVGRNRYATLLMVLATVTFANQIARKPIVMSNIGVGPIETRLGRWLAGWTLRQVDVLSVRDERSRRTCLQLGLAPDRVQCVPDAVFVNPPEVFGVAHPDSCRGHHRCPRPTALDAATHVIRPPLRVALNLNYDIENPANWETFLTNLSDALQIVHSRRRIEIHAVPMQSCFKAENDWKVLSEFRARIPEIAMTLHRPETHREAARIIADCDMLIAERLHALVMAAILGVPCIALMYDVKVRALVAGLDIEPYAVDINRPFDPDDLAGRIEALCRDAAAARSHLLARSAALRRELEGYFAELKRRLA